MSRESQTTLNVGNEHVADRFRSERRVLSAKLNDDVTNTELLEYLLAHTSETAGRSAFAEWVESYRARSE